jgi:hypothetical protein
LGASHGNDRTVTLLDLKDKYRSFERARKRAANVWTPAAELVQRRDRIGDLVALGHRIRARIVADANIRDRAMIRRTS